MMEKIQQDADRKDDERSFRALRSPYNEAGESEAKNQPKCSPADILQGYSIMKKKACVLWAIALKNGSQLRARFELNLHVRSVQAQHVNGGYEHLLCGLQQTRGRPKRGLILDCGSVRALG